MAAERALPDFLYCNVCRIHHNLGMKHKYSLNHRRLCKEVTSKFKQKIKQCKLYLDKPDIVDGELEPGASFWCQFCEKKVQKHVTDGKLSIKYGGSFEHLSSPEHRKKIHAYWKVNGGDRSEKSDFCLSSDDHTKFKTKCQEGLQKFNNKLEEQRFVTAEEIKKTELQRAITVAAQREHSSERLEEVKTVNNSHGVLQNPTGWHNGVRVWRGGIVKSRTRVKTNQATVKRRDVTSTQGGDDDRQLKNLPSLSRVARAPRNSSASSFRGNIHTGAIPPWLRTDEDINEKKSQDDTAEIGPSFEEFKKHVDKQKKKRANPNRVGANFDREAKKDDNWLPSFGSVWNSGPRWHSRKEYKTKTKSVVR